MGAPSLEAKCITRYKCPLTNALDDLSVFQWQSLEFLINRVFRMYLVFTTRPSVLSPK
jgi:hypothetical protein